MSLSLRNPLISPRGVESWLERRPRGVLAALDGVLAFSLLLTTTISCGSSASGPRQAKDIQTSGFKIESTAFKPAAEIPKRFTCEGEDISPPLQWTHPPQGTQSFVLIVEDPDAPSGTWIHWVVYDLPARVQKLPVGVPKQPQVAGGGVQGRNDFGGIGYGGPCPPAGRAHHYLCRLYALDTTLNLRPGVAKEEVIASAKGHVLGEAQLMGLFGR